MFKNFVCLEFMLLFVVACNGDKTMLEQSLSKAGKNRGELEYVLDYYSDCPEKYEAAKFLIANMYEHYSYADGKINQYYHQAFDIITSSLTIDEQIDSLASISKNRIGKLKRVTDVKKITAQYLIYSIEHAFRLWKNQPWAMHLTFEEFREWVLPYKVAEYQEFDKWRDTLPIMFADTLAKIDKQSEMVMFNTIFRVEDLVRNEMLKKIQRNGLYRDGGYPLLSTSTMSRMTFGHCSDYINLIVATYRSVGIPVVIDRTPFYGRFRAGHTWHTILTDRGWHLPSAWDLATVPGHNFFLYERFPKVYRQTYAINPERLKYVKTAKYPYSFNLCEIDVTDNYTRTSDICVDIIPKIKLKDIYCYLAVFNGHDEVWSIVDYGKIENNKAVFKNIGRNVLYIVMSYDRMGQHTISNPFILHQNGESEYVLCDTTIMRSIDMRRKYYESANVVDKRRRLLGAEIQCANSPDFSDFKTVYTITTTKIPDKIAIETKSKYRYWRYFASNGTFGSVAELAFFDKDTNRLHGEPIACLWADTNAVINATDDNWLTNFETDVADSNWVGIDMKTPVKVTFVRVVPRGDDNDICPGNEYELRYWSGSGWKSVGRQIATDNSLHFDNIPSGTLFWLKNHTRGWDERPFRVDNNGNIEWR